MGLLLKAPAGCCGSRDHGSIRHQRRSYGRCVRAGLADVAVGRPVGGPGRQPARPSSWRAAVSGRVQLCPRLMSCSSQASSIGCRALCSAASPVASSAPSRSQQLERLCSAGEPQRATKQAASTQRHRAAAVAARPPPSHRHRRHRCPPPPAGPPPCRRPPVAAPFCRLMVNTEDDGGGAGLPSARAAGYRGGLSAAVIVVAAVAASGGLQFGYNLVGGHCLLPAAGKLPAGRLRSERDRAPELAGWLTAPPCRPGAGGAAASRHRAAPHTQPLAHTQGVAGGVSSMSPFLQAFFPDVRC